MTELTLDQALQKGVEAHKAGNAQEADRYYTAILKAQPNHPDANHNMGVLAAGVGKLEMALPFFEKAIEVNSTIAQFWLSLIDALIKLKRFDEAQSILKRAKANGFNTDSFNKLEKQIAISKQESGRSQEIQDPPNEELKNIISLYGQGSFQQVLDLATQLLKQFPASSQLYNMCGAAFSGLEKYEDAVKSYQRAIEIRPDYAPAYFHMANSYKNEGEYENAIKSYESAVRVKPDFSEAYFNMANTLKKLGRLEEALASYQLALKANPNFAEAHHNIGNILIKSDRVEDAIDHFNMAVQINPNYEVAKHMLRSLSGKKTTNAPQAYVEKLFDNYAERFEGHLTESLQYDTPRELTEIIKSLIGNEKINSALDLGCGTGLLGDELKIICNKIVGIDLSKEMLKYAEKKNVYDALMHEEILDYLSTAKLDYDLIICADVFVYLGELHNIFRLIKERNCVNALFAFSTEHGEGKNFNLEKSGRFSHSKGYIDTLCNEYDFKIEHFSLNDLRKEKGNLLKGGLYVLKTECT